MSSSLTNARPLLRRGYCISSNRRSGHPVGAINGSYEVIRLLVRKALDIPNVKANPATRKLWSFF